MRRLYPPWDGWGGGTEIKFYHPTRVAKYLPASPVFFFLSKISSIMHTTTISFHLLPPQGLFKADQCSFKCTINWQLIVPSKGSAKYIYYKWNGHFGPNPLTNYINNLDFLTISSHQTNNESIPIDTSHEKGIMINIKVHLKWCDNCH